ncbi:MAG TPA: hypothetical protein GX405_16945 [Rhizobiales bacterium]|nr:hypothetical protein [Hyphomicrobiales bacterium]
MPADAMRFVKDGTVPDPLLRSGEGTVRSMAEGRRGRDGDAPRTARDG